MNEDSVESGKGKKNIIIVAVIIVSLVILFLLVGLGYLPPHATGGEPGPYILTVDDYLGMYNNGEFDIGEEVGICGTAEYLSGNSTWVNFTIDDQINLNCSVSDWQIYTDWIESGEDVQQSESGSTVFYNLICWVTITEDSYDFKEWNDTAIVGTGR